MKITPLPLPTLQVSPHWAKLPVFDRKGWQRVRFGDVVENLNETCDPDESGIERFIGLEHMEPGSLHIRMWGNVADGTTFARRCRSGQVLFGKRRAYQRKVAIAEFDAVVSGDIYVLESKGDRLRSELLPFLCLSERFFQHAVGTSAGSLSPRTNWDSLASFEFELPPLDKQRRILDVLQAANDATENAGKLLDQLARSGNASFDEALRVGTGTKPASLRRLGDALKRIVAGKSPKSSSLPATGEEYGVLKVSAVGDGVYREDENKALLIAADFDSSFEVKAGMILVTRANALLSGIGRACVVDRTRKGLMLSDKTLELVPDESIVDPDFLLQGLRSQPYRGYVERSANGTDAKNISQEILRRSPFWLPDLKEQKRIARELSEFSNALNAATLNSTRLGMLRASIANTLVE